MKRLLRISILFTLTGYLSGCGAVAPGSAESSADGDLSQNHRLESSNGDLSGSGSEDAAARGEGSRTNSREDDVDSRPDSSSDSTQSASQDAASNNAASNNAASNDAASDNAAAPRNAARPPSDDRVVDATFEDLNCNMQEDIVFRPWMITDRASELDGRRIRIAGYMLPDLKQKGIKEFVLLKNTQCKFGPGGQADHLIRIRLVEGVSTSYRGDIPLEVVGRLSINPFQGVDGNTWSIYDLDGESVRRYQR